MVGGAGGGAGSPELCSCGGAAPEKTELGLPGADSNGVWVGRHLRGMRKALVAMGRWFGAPSVTLVGDGGSAAQGSPVLACSGSYGAPWLRELAQKQEGVGAQLTGGSRRPGL